MPLRVHCQIRSGFFGLSCTKVVLATSIAETSITIDDVVFVIDSGRMKRAMTHQKNGIAEECLVSSGAGELGVRPTSCSPVHEFHWFDASVAGIKRVPLEQLCLRIKILGYGSVQSG